MEERTIKEKMEYNLGCRLFNILDVNAQYSNEIIRSADDKTREETYDVDLALRKKIGTGRGQMLGLKFEWNNVTEDEDAEWCADKCGMLACEDLELCSDCDGACFAESSKNRQQGC